MSGGPEMRRRDVLRLLALAPVAGVVEWAGADVARAAAAVERLAAGPPFQPAFFTEAEWATVRVLADDVIPRDERSGSATDAKAPEFMDFMLADETATESARTAMRDGLRWLDEESRRRFGAPYAELDEAQRHAILDDIAWPARARPEHEAAVSFFNRFRDLTAAGFFSSEMGWKDLQYIGHTFVPEWQGCPDEALRKLGVTYDLMNTRVPIEHGRD